MQHSDIHAKFSIPNSPQPPDIRTKSHRGIPDFQISCQSLIKENCHYFRTSDDTDIELGPVTKIDKRNKTKPKKLTMTSYRDDADNDDVNTNCDVIIMFPIYGQFVAFRKPDSGPTVCKLTFSLIITFYLKKTKSGTKIFPTQPSHYCFE